MKSWNTLPEPPVVERTVAALKENGIQTELVPTAEEAARRALALIPPEAEVFTGTSITLERIGLARELNESGRYVSVKGRLGSMNPETESREMRKLGAGPDVAVGSVHAITESGVVLIASLTGSQIPAYSHGAGTVIWIAGAQKIVKDIDEGMRRIQDYLVEKESERSRAAYGLPQSFSSYPSKILIFQREIQPGRIHLFLVNQVLGI
jgi:LUD domain